MNSIIHLQTNPDLSPKHIQFNKLITSIAKLRDEIRDEEHKLELFSEYYTKHVVKIQVGYANRLIDMAKKLDLFSCASILPDSTMNELEILIPGLLSDSFLHVLPELETKALYQKWEGLNFDEIEKAAKEETLEELRDYLRSMGIDITLDDIDFDDPLGDEKLHQRFREAKKQLDQKEAAFKATKKKTKKQIANEKMSIIQDELKNKSLRSVYLSLAKMLHPDTEADPDIKLEKEEVMKLVTKSYEDKDIISLLVIEANWLKNTEERLSNITEDVASIYISLLKEQAKKLRKEKDQLIHHPRFQHVAHHVSLKLDQGIFMMSSQEALIKRNLRVKDREIDLIENGKRTEVKKMIKSLSKNYLF